MPDDDDDTFRDDELFWLLHGDEPLSDAELAQDSHDSYFEAITAISEEVRAGRPLPAMFQPRERPVQEAMDV